MLYMQNQGYRLAVFGQNAFLQLACFQSLSGEGQGFYLLHQQLAGVRTVREFLGAIRDERELCLYAFFQRLFVGSNH